MKQFTSTQLPPLQFNPKIGKSSVKTNAVGHKIGWLHTIADQPGASFDITIKDGLGRIKMQKNNCRTDTKEYGELVNAPTLLGEHLEVEVSNLKGAESLSVFLN